MNKQERCRELVIKYNNGELNLMECNEMWRLMDDLETGNDV